MAEGVDPTAAVEEETVANDQLPEPKKAASPTVPTEVIKIINKVRTPEIIIVKSLTKRAPKPVRTSQLTPVLATGRRGRLRPTAPTPWCAAGSTSSPREPEKLAKSVLK